MAGTEKNDGLHDDAARSLRRMIYALLIVIAAGGAVGRICAVQSPRGDTPFLSANDRSRWCTIRALVDHGTYAIDQIVLYDAGEAGGGVVFDNRWQTIDMVRHRGADGREHYYSSKPPLFPTILAGQYWVIKQLSGATFADQPLYVGRIMLVITNVLPLIVYLAALAHLVEQIGTTNWGRIFVVASASAGTFLTTFAVTLNNHLPAAITVLLAVCAALPIWRDGERRWIYFAACGFFAALTAANELPAALLVALLGAGLLWKAPRGALLGFAPAAAAVAIAFFSVNYAAHQSWRPPYAHRSDGAVLTILSGSVGEDLERNTLSETVRRTLRDEAGVDLSAAAEITATNPGQRWVVWDEEGHDRFAIVRGAEGFEVRAWDDWYEYEASYWTDDRKTGVDRGEPSRAVYAFHVLVGHHGIFSLTPIWLLSAAGAVVLLRQSSSTLRALAWLTIIVSVVVVGFYIARPLVDRNYGGVSCGLRWAFWMIPLWLLVMAPAADWMSKTRWRRGLALLLLAVSVASANYAALDPWSSPWLFDYLSYLGWIQY